MSHLRVALTLALGAFAALGGCATAGNHLEPYRDVACFGRAKVSLVQAIETAELSSNGQVVDAEYNCEEELGCVRGIPGRYDVTLFEQGTLRRVSVCAEKGIVGPPYQAHGLARLSLDSGWPESEMLRGAPVTLNAQVGLADAIAAAEKTGGKAMAAHLKTEGGVTYYAIELVRAGRVQIVLVDLHTGYVRT